MYGIAYPCSNSNQSVLVKISPYKSDNWGICRDFSIFVLVSTAMFNLF